LRKEEANPCGPRSRFELNISEPYVFSASDAKLIYTFEDPFRGTCRRIDLGCFTGWTGTAEVGVDFEEDTVDEEMVIALPDEG